MITYTWNIFGIDCAPSENGLINVVKIVHWGLTGVDENGVSASFSNSYPLPSQSPEAFTDYSTLTEETVIGWLESNLDIGYLQTVIANEIASKYNPPITSLPLPWVEVEEPIITEEPVIEVIEEPVVVEEPVLEVIEEPVVTEEPTSTEPTLEEKIVDGYNPDANDGDDDGIVQEGTKWERPLGTEL
tara:strand:+ start:5718 stop:6278 length:561 start_codon:yes stop_codon:yes gene_type:complete